MSEHKPRIAPKISYEESSETRALAKRYRDVSLRNLYTDFCKGRAEKIYETILPPKKQSSLN